MDPNDSTRPVLLNQSSISTPASENLTHDFVAQLTPDIPTQTIPSPSDSTHLVWRSKTAEAVSKSSLPTETKNVILKAVNLPFDQTDSPDGQFLLTC